MTQAARPASPVPTYPSRFVGRSAELEVLHAQLAAGRRVITLVGTAGVGKTRLAVEFAGGGGRAPGAMSVGFCDLAAAQTLDEVCESVVSALRIPPGGGDLKGGVAEYIGQALARRGALLLVLDNFEQAAEHAAATVGLWQKAAPDVVFLVTSRAALRVHDEKVVALEPLALAPAAVGDAPGARPAPSEAVQLFLDGAAHVLGRAPGTAEELELVEQIVRHLDGLPLAIELAAARLEVLSLAELRARLSERFRVLRDPSGVPGSRHTTLWHAIDWSWTLLAPGEQETLAQASVFAGGFDLEGAEAVIDFGAAARSSADVLDAVQNLCRKSLLRVVRASAAGGTRFVWYESIREYAAVRLAESGAAGAVEARHAAHYLARGEEWAHGADGAQGATLLDRLALEYDNVLAVFNRALADGGTPAEERALVALRALYVLTPVLAARGAPAVHLRLLDAAMALAHGTPAAATVWAARALHAHAVASRVLGHMDTCLWDLARAIPIAERAGDRALLGQLRAFLAHVCELQGMRDAAAEQADIALRIAREARDPLGEGMALVYRGIQKMNRNDHAGARACLEPALAVLRSVGHRQMEETALAHLGIMYADEDRVEPARACFEAALVIARELGMRRREAVLLGYLAVGYHVHGALAEAAQAYQRALAILHEYSDRRFEGVYRAFYGMLRVEQAEVDDGAAQAERAVALLGGTRDARNQGTALAALALARARQGRVSDAEELVAQAEAALARDDADAAVLALVEAARAGLEVARAEVLAADGDAAGSDALVERARGRVAARADVLLSDVRIALRVARSALVRHDAEASCWVVDREGRWFEPPRGERISLANRPTLALVLQALLRARVDQPGATLSVRALTEAAWPGEKLLPEAAKNRVRVAVSSLRKLGLDAVLKHSERGYRLDPDAPLRASEDRA